MLTKVAAVYDRPFWRDAGLNGAALDTGGPISVTFDDSPPERHARDRVRVRRRRQRPRATRRCRPRAAAPPCSTSSRRFFGPEARKPREFFETSWAEQQWTRGCPVGIPAVGALVAYGPRIRAAGRADPLGRHRDLDVLERLHGRRRPLGRARGREVLVGLCIADSATAREALAGRCSSRIAAARRRSWRTRVPGSRPGDAPMATVREATFDLFRAHGMTTIFGNPGSTELPMLADFPDDFTLRAGAAGAGGRRDGRRLRPGHRPPDARQPAHRAGRRQRGRRDLQRAGEQVAAGDHRRPAGARRRSRSRRT